MQAKTSSERGNIFVYVLITIVLFAALTFILARQEDAGEATALDEDRARIIATQLISASAQVTSAVEQMTFAGTEPDSMEFVRPGQPGYDTPPHLDKVFHPDGGGVILNPLPAAAIDDTITSPPSGWYLGSFNHVEWTKTANDDVILTAYGIQEDVCLQLNDMILGEAVNTPIISGIMVNFLIDDADHSGTNADFTIGDCNDCENLPSACVQNAAGTIFAFYNIIIGE